MRPPLVFAQETDSGVWNAGPAWPGRAPWGTKMGIYDEYLMYYFALVTALAMCWECPAASSCPAPVSELPCISFPALGARNRQQRRFGCRLAWLGSAAIQSESSSGNRRLSIPQRPQCGATPHLAGQAAEAHIGGKTVVVTGVGCPARAPEKAFEVLAAQQARPAAERAAGGYEDEAQLDLNKVHLGA